ncbi:hypothetical protein DSO57_1008214 [Entomophthora muscae]|uniref:Uncharacterized protein n=1 Tax=Entomophthora muscae TaxID=34485 RepID=A0ACC2SW12_9FUNG|nr:hypothetical protein DSO57_1008214 [Entomophthora muscae]
MKLALPVLCVLGLNDILIDTDPGIDDVMSIFMALGTPDVNVRAITMTFGNTVLKNVARNIVSIFHALDLQKNATGKEKYRNNIIPRLAVGADKPLKGPRYTGGYFHGVDGLGNLTITHPELIADDFQDYFNYDFDKALKTKRRKPKKTSHRFIASPLNAVDEILYQLKSLPPLTLTIVAIGPLTNIALAIQKDPVTMSRAKRIVVMGGALLVPGNITPMSEFNFYVDPYAVNVVFNATRGFKKHRYFNLLQQPNPDFSKPHPLRVTLVPVNLTHTTLMTQANMESYLLPIRNQPIPTFFANMLTIPFQRSEKIHGLALHDPVAMGIALDIMRPRPLIKRYSIQVEEDSKIARGLCVIDLRPKAKPAPIDDDINIEVAYATHRPELFQYAVLKASFPRN